VTPQGNKTKALRRFSRAPLHRRSGDETAAVFGAPDDIAGAVNRRKAREGYLQSTNVPTESLGLPLFKTVRPNQLRILAPLSRVKPSQPGK